MVISLCTIKRVSFFFIFFISFFLWTNIVWEIILNYLIQNQIILVPQFTNNLLYGDYKKWSFTQVSLDENIVSNF